MNIRKSFSSGATFPKTLSENIYNYLKEAIINNELKANQRIDENQIASAFNVSRTPVREAVLRLAADGFVSLTSYRRATVKEITTKDLADILQVICVLDKLAVKLTLHLLSDKEIKKLEFLTEKMEKACKKNDTEKFLQINVAFHNDIWKFVPNKILQDFLYFLSEKKELYTYARIQAFSVPGTLQKSMEHHRELIKSIKEKNISQVLTLIENHRNILIDSKND